MPVIKKTSSDLIADICMRGLLIKQQYQKQVAKKNPDPTELQKLVKELKKINQDCKQLMQLLESLED